MPDFEVMMRGYDQQEVDDLLAQVAAGAVTAEGLRRTSFTVVMRGYDPDAVDLALSGHLRDLERLERTTSGQWRIVRRAT